MDFCSRGRSRTSISGSATTDMFMKLHFRRMFVIALVVMVGGPLIYAGVSIWWGVQLEIPILPIMKKIPFLNCVPGAAVCVDKKR
jgi:hypothetical protein